MRKPKSISKRVARENLNTLSKTPPREFICLVGGPTNTFNGWYTVIEHKDGRDDYFFAAGPEPRTRREIDFYINSEPKAVDLGAGYEFERWRELGWSANAVYDLRERGWKGTDIVSWPTGTHDLYWANFIESAARLYQHDDPLPAPMVRPKVREGDIVTFLVYAPAYLLRQAIDWQASPYNPVHRHKPEAAKHFQPAFMPKEPRMPGPRPAPVTLTRQQQIELAKRKARLAAERRADADRVLPLRDIDYYILTRTIGENDGDIIRRPNRGSVYIEYLHGLPQHVVPHDRAMVKVLLFNTVDQAVRYIHDGVWEGSAIDSLEPLEADGASGRQREFFRRTLKRMCPFGTPEAEIEELIPYGDYEQANYLYSPTAPIMGSDTPAGTRGPTYWNKFWGDAPNVNRGKVKICRFDYFGHAVSDQIWLQYGWTNAKGSWPEVDKDPLSGREIAFGKADLDKAFAGVTTADAFAGLWGCNLGQKGQLGDGIVGALFKTVVGADIETTFAEIVKHRKNMPKPSDGRPWRECEPGEAWLKW